MIVDHAKILLADETILYSYSRSIHRVVAVDVTQKRTC